VYVTTESTDKFLFFPLPLTCISLVFVYHFIQPDSPFLHLSQGPNYRPLSVDYQPKLQNKNLRLLMLSSASQPSAELLTITTIHHLELPQLYQRKWRLHSSQPRMTIKRYAHTTIYLNSLINSPNFVRYTTRLQRYSRQASMMVCPNILLTFTLIFITNQTGRLLPWSFASPGTVPGHTIRKLTQVAGNALNQLYIHIQ